MRRTGTLKTLSLVGALFTLFGVMVSGGPLLAAPTDAGVDAGVGVFATLYAPASKSFGPMNVGEGVGPLHGLRDEAGLGGSSRWLSASLGATDIRGGLETTPALRVLESALPALARCADSKATRLRVTLHITTAGHVEGTSTEDDAGLSHCVVSTLERLRFKPLPRGVAELKQTFVFER